VRVLDAENHAPVPTIAVTSRDGRFLESVQARSHYRGQLKSVPRATQVMAAAS
jgi:hypothetical protein